MNTLYLDLNKEIIPMLKIYPYYESTLTLVNLEK